MRGNDPEDVVGKLVDAYGGTSLLNELEAIDGTLSASGLIFLLKKRPLMHRVRMRALVREPRFTVFDYPRAGENSEFLGDDEVRITSSGGSVLERRLQPRKFIRGPGKLLRWDALDFTYFAGYATWNYFLFPFLFLRPGFEFKFLEPLRGSAAAWTRLQVTFPKDTPTHSRIQTFYFDEAFHLRRHDYTAEVVGNWARASQYCDRYRHFDGLLAPTWRRVRPRLGNRPLPWPDLVALDIESLKPIRKGELEGESTARAFQST